MQQSFFSAQFSYPLRGNLADQDVAVVNFGTDPDDPVFVQVLQGVFTNVRDFPGNFFRPQLGVTGF